MRKVKITFSIVVFLFVSNSLIGQTLGVRGGLNISSFPQNIFFYGYDDKISPSNKLGINFGGTLEKSVLENLSVETGLFYTQKGFKHTERYQSTEYNDKFILNYIQVPINLRLYKELDNFSIFGLFGTHFGIVTKGGMDWDDEDFEKLNFNQDSDFRRVDIGGSLGVGILYNSFEFLLNYDRSIRSITSRHDSNINKVFGISVGYKFYDLKLFN